jgi:hypothetical protein
VELLWVVVIGTSIWVAIDASSLGARRGALGGGPFDMGVAAWFLVCLLMWVIGFPAYLATRSRYVALKRSSAVAPVAGYPSPAFTNFPPAQPPVAPSTRWQPQPGVAETGWTSSGPMQPARDSLVDELARLAAMRDTGALTQAEFDMLKAQKLRQHGSPETF